MISKIGVENKQHNRVRTAHTVPSKQAQIPAFKGGLWNVALGSIQACERNPMVNVAVIDLFSAILPRTFVESLTNVFAGFEAFRRESSGLIVNCMIPGVVTMGFAAALNNFIMPKGSNMASCWADNSLIQKASDIYSNSKSDDKIKDSLKEILKNIEGTNTDKAVKFGTALSNSEIEQYADKLKELSTSDKSSKELRKEINKITREIADKTHVFEGVHVGDVKATTTTTLLEDSVKFFREFQKAPKGTAIADFAKKSKKLVVSKSALGLAFILPLAASMQYINRWITEKASGVKGAPIYDDFGKEGNEDVRAKAKEGLLKQKIISIASMVGVAMLSIMKMPSLSMFKNMLEFKGIFPTMDQARLISTTTFASRMAAADDKNELAEATVRDIATFSSMYFLGDYVAKATATAIEKKSDIKLLNDTKPLKGNENALQRFWHWVKDVNIKSSEEVFSNTAEKLKNKGLTPTAEQKKIIDKELKKAVNMRSACQAANLGVSLLLLGLVIPIFTRKNTQKKHAEAIKTVHGADLGNTATQIDNDKQMRKNTTV